MRTFQSQPQITPIFILAVAVFFGACRPTATLPTRSSPEYNEIVRTFYVGLAALQVGHDVQAESSLAKFTQLVAAEPAGWANWGLLALRQKNFDAAAERIERARSLADDNGDIYYLLGLLESSRGKTAEAITALRKSIELNPQNLLATYKLAEELEREGNEEEFQRLVQQILAIQPDNLAALLELSRVAAKRGDAETLKSCV
ncbi:MAG TPA: tetratricopeptide repeat protein, partial [Pyrinomonadaceae bacterium]|nr:tetratricopeptide repeat protein [Pyrinomonadaceae bacterium]